jgi:hypothetical protein
LDLVSPPIWRGVARRLAQWHAALPSSGTVAVKDDSVTEIADVDADITVIQPRRAGPSIWAVLQKWVLALPVATPEQRARRLSLQAELQWVVDLLDDGKGIGEDGVCCASIVDSFGGFVLIAGFIACLLTLRSPLRERHRPPEREQHPGSRRRHRARQLH